MGKRTRSIICLLLIVFAWNVSMNINSGIAKGVVFSVSILHGLRESQWKQLYFQLPFPAVRYAR